MQLVVLYKDPLYLTFTRSCCTRSVVVLAIDMQAVTLLVHKFYGDDYLLNPAGKFFAKRMV